MVFLHTLHGKMVLSRSLALGLGWGAGAGSGVTSGSGVVGATSSGLGAGAASRSNMWSSLEVSSAWSCPDMGLRRSTGWASFFWSATTGLGWVKRVKASSSASVPPTRATIPLEQPIKIKPARPRRSQRTDFFGVGVEVLVCFVLLMACEVPRQRGRLWEPTNPNSHKRMLVRPVVLLPKCRDSVALCTSWHNWAQKLNTPPTAKA